MTKQFNLKTGSRGIEWTDETRNAIGGCLHDCKWKMPDGTIAVCYAKALAESGVAKSAYPHGFEHHYWRLSALKSLASGDIPRLIFCDSMSDMFAPNVPAEDVHAILDAMRTAPHHSYQSLTKAAPQLLKYAEHMPPNLWVGVSSPPDCFMGSWLTQSQQEAMLRRSLDVLAEVKKRTGNLVWMSAEPVSWNVTPIIDEGHALDWIVVGAASSGRKYYQPAPDHIRDLLTIMDITDTPVFFKGNLRPLFASNDLGTTSLNRWREDFPVNYRDGKAIAAVAARQRLCAKHGWTGIELPLCEAPHHA
jgi:protein gp37